MTKIYVLAWQYGLEQCLLYVIQTSEGPPNGGGDTRALFQELLIQLKDTFHFTKEHISPISQYDPYFTWIRDVNLTTMPGPDL